MSEPRHAAQLFPHHEVHRLMQQRSRVPQQHGASLRRFAALRNTSQVRRTLAERRADQAVAAR
jgi:hypothetical protein